MQAAQTDLEPSPAKKPPKPEWFRCWDGSKNQVLTFEESSANLIVMVLYLISLLRIIL